MYLRHTKLVIMKKTLLEPKLGIKKTRRLLPRGSFLIESTVSLFLLVVISLVLVDASFNILAPRTWTMQQNLVDAYLSQEVALANREPFSSIENGASAWGAGANVPTAAVTVGRLPGFVAGGVGRNYNVVSVNRIRVTNQANNAVPGFKPTAGAFFQLSDLGIRSYALQTHVVYTLNNQTYVKSRTVIRSQ